MEASSQKVYIAELTEEQFHRMVDLLVLPQFGGVDGLVLFGAKFTSNFGRTENFLHLQLLDISTVHNHSLMALEIPELKVEPFFQADATSALAQRGMEIGQFAGYMSNSDCLTGEFVILPPSPDDASMRRWGNVWAPTDGNALATWSLEMNLRVCLVMENLKWEGLGLCRPSDWAPSCWSQR